MSESPVVSIIIPCRNEEKYIAECLDSIVNSDYPKDKLEALVVDGISDDETRRIVQEYAKQYAFIRLLDNPKKITPVAMNIGIKESRGEIIFITSSHSKIEKNFISQNVRYLKECDADCVGGLSIIAPAKDTLVARSIAAALTAPFGRGNVPYLSKPEKPKLVDTATRPCYKKKVFEKIGLFNEFLKRGQDYEFSLRLKKAGGKMFLIPDISSYYYPKSNFVDFFKHNCKDGFWITYPLGIGVKAFALRHLVPMAFISALLVTGIGAVFFQPFLWLFLAVLGSYLSVSLYASCLIAAAKKDIRYLFLVPVAFACRHTGYGLGALWGFVKCVTLLGRSMTKPDKTQKTE